MECLYAPWRKSYAQSTARSKHETATAQECTFCEQITDKKDEEHFILRRFKHHYILLNLYPYNAGHLLIVPLEHKGNLEDLSQEARCELADLMMHCTTILKNDLKAEGINIGINMGKASGAGIPSHLHTHVLPRWSGDTNFLPTIAGTKVVSFDLREMYNRLKPSFDTLQL